MGRRTHPAFILTTLLAGMAVSGFAASPTPLTPGKRLSGPVSNDYLTVVGPPPLRFHSISTAGPLKVSLPPLPIPQKEEPGADLSETTPPATPPAPPKQPEPKKPGEQSSADFTEPEVEVQAVQPQEDPEIQPDSTDMAETEQPVGVQMLLKYFQKNRDSGSVSGIVAPMGFTPPAASPSSRATYTSNP